MCNNPNWQPLEFKENGDMKGIVIDTMKILKKNLNIKFEYIKTKSWSQSQQYLKEKKCDILPAAIKTAKRSKYAIFTHPYLHYKLAIITQDDKPFVENINDIIDKSISRKKGSGLISKLKSLYPNINIIETKGYLEALAKVSKGEAYCTIATLPVASFYINQFKLNNLHVAGYIDMTYRLSIATRNDKIELKNILDKALRNISPQEYQKINNKWTGVQLKSQFDYSLLIKIAIFIFVIVLFILYRQKLLSTNNKELKKLIDEKTKNLKEINENLEQKVIIEIEKSKKQEKQLNEAAKMAQMGELIGNIAHQWRQPLSVITTITSGMQLEKEYDRLSDDKFNTSCDTILRNSQYLSNTIETFRNFITEDHKLKRFIIQDRINIALNIIDPLLKSNNITLINNINYENKIETLLISGNLSQVIINIFNNSKDILEEKNISNPWIKISLEKIETYAQLTIEDNGGGIKEENLLKVFDPYFTTKHKSQGIGMGLYNTYNLVTKNLNGKIYVKNTQNGAKFFIEIPIKLQENS